MTKAKCLINPSSALNNWENVGKKSERKENLNYKTSLVRKTKNSSRAISDKRHETTEDIFELVGLPATHS